MHPTAELAQATVSRPLPAAKLGKGRDAKIPAMGDRLSHRQTVHLSPRPSISGSRELPGFALLSSAARRGIRAPAARTWSSMERGRLAQMRARARRHIEHALATVAPTQERGQLSQRLPLAMPIRGTSPSRASS